MSHCNRVSVPRALSGRLQRAMAETETMVGPLLWRELTAEEQATLILLRIRQVTADGMAYTPVPFASAGMDAVSPTIH
jgi:hypothetical protein